LPHPMQGVARRRVTKSMDIEQQLLIAVDKMPAFPKSVQRVLELTRSADVAPKAIVEVIEKDPVMTARILRVINSAFYALPNKVSGVGHAVILLGINTVKNLAIRIAAVGMIPIKNDAGFDTDQYLLHSLGCAEVSRLIAQKLGDADTTEAYLGGLLHDIGKILFALYLPQPFRAALDRSASNGTALHIAEQELIGVDHTVAGAMLARKWQLPDSLVDSIRNHHLAPPEQGPGRSLSIANQIMKTIAFGHSGNPAIDALPATLGGSLGNDYESIALALPGLEEQLKLVRHYASERAEA
jgi:putative nucleotidyltransferase with HDIG domain